ncbi:hypothetical protein Thal_1531 [Thermocrinis albus DSM 14484]|uniref:Lipoprotein n=1 Tax=Thermocrinis albus (strain DSM 14484 / JCM 11386 / HI 11/12) TaxID=638303 RepID=D3SN30_THEAH|nr:hypothetical protein [Thermocrinis albus]ADC90160.1 hypothetical protein Thal_1531 [Thermocrinis albus DSM 14484]
MRKYLSLAALSFLVSCGGGGSDGYKAFDSVTVTLSSIEPQLVQADVINLVKDQNTNQCYPVADADTVTIKLRSDTIKDASGKPITNNPSPVYVYRYRVTFIPQNPSQNPCENNPPCRQTLAQGIDASLSITLLPDSELTYQGIAVTLADWDNGPVRTVCSSAGGCYYTARIELYVREVLSGREKVLSGSVTVDFADYADPGCPP